MKCNLCPRNCNADREKGELGYCRAPADMVIARYSRHMWEEPIISGDKGSGTIFFSYCNMGCCFCQNYEISELYKGKIVDIHQFVDICLDLQHHGVNNINLVTPTMYVPSIIKGIRLAKEKGLEIPIIYNTSSYENVDTIKMLDGYIDVYLPDLKFYDDHLAKRYAGISHYFDYASRAIDEMVNQVGNVILDDNGIIKKGVVIRHMVMPNHVDDSKRIIKYLYDRYGDRVYISIMNQYTPVRHSRYPELNRKVKLAEYDEIVNYAYDLGIRNAFIQEDDTQDESFIPNFEEFNGLD